jgi:hypothetical protein
MHSPILSVRLFGSHARGDAEKCSDMDILCILDSVTEQQKIEASSLICAAYGESASVTFYGRQRFREMFDEGHLFAWHIFTESRSLPGLTGHDWIAQLGKPHPYTRAIQDIRDLADIMASIPENLRRCLANNVYEAGLLYLCLRNIAISLSWHSQTGLDFSRFAPFHLAPPLLAIPLSLDRYRTYLGCRLATTRGLTPSQLDPESVRADANLCLDWCVKNINILQHNEKTEVLG